MESELAEASRERPPTPLLLAAAVVALEGLGAVGFGAAEALNIASTRAVMGVSTALFFVAFGGGVILCAWGLLRVQTWARGPVLLTQLMALGLAWNFRGGETTWIALVLAVPGALGLVAMLHPRSVEALRD